MGCLKIREDFLNVVFVNKDKDPGPPICVEPTCIGNGGGQGITSPTLPENEIYFYHPDHLGSTSYITNIQGETVQFNSYLPFGEDFVSQQRTTSVSAFLFNGKEKDLETSLYYYGARYYNPKISNWLSVDAPLINGHYLNGNHDGGVFNSYNLSAYGYCRQNPVIYIDPDGNQIRPVGTGWFKMTHTENFLKNSHLNIDVKGNKVPTILPKFEAKDFNLNAGGYNKPGISATPKEIKNPFQGNGFDPNPQMGDTPDTPSDARGNMRNTSSIDKGMGLVEGIKQLFQLKDNVSDVLNASKAIDFDKAMGVGREQASDFGKAIDITNKYDLSGQFKADVTNYIFDGSLPEGNKGMQNSSIISTGTQILKANNLPVRSESQNLNR